MLNASNWFDSIWWYLLLMDVCSGKRVVNGPLVPRRGRDTPNNNDETVQQCSQLESSGPLNHSKSSRVGVTEKHRPPRPTFNSSNRKDMVESSSRKPPMLTNVRKKREESRIKTFSQVRNDHSEVSSFTEQMQSSPEYRLWFNPSARGNGASKATSTEVGCSDGTSTGGPHKITKHKSASYDQQTPMRSSISSSSKAADSEKRPCSNGAGHVLKNLKCNSTSVVSSQNFSTSESRFSRTDKAKWRNAGESSSSAKGNKIIEASPIERHVSRPTRGISISESRGSRNLGYRVDNHAWPIQNCRSMNVNSRYRDAVRDSLQTESSGLAQNLYQSETQNLNLLLSRQPFTGGSSSDQYRDMRLDIDNMSYEELLALGEWIGTVSTTLSKEALSKCIRRHIYQGIYATVRAVGGGYEDEIKCSICLEEYMVGDEIGKLGCEHGYHVECVQQWLKLKNWCPICKASAASSDSEPTKMPSRMYKFMWMGGFCMFSFFLIFYILSHFDF